MRGIVSSPRAYLDTPEYDGYDTSREYFEEIYLGDYHRDRLLAAAHEFNWPDAVESLAGHKGDWNFHFATMETCMSSREKIVDLKVRLRSHR